MDLTWLAASVLDGSEKCEGFHADVCSLPCFRAEGNGFFIKNNCVATWARVWASGAVGVVDLHMVILA